MRILLSIERAASQPRDGAYMPETIDALVSPKQPLKLKQRNASFPFHCPALHLGDQALNAVPASPLRPALRLHRRGEPSGLTLLQGLLLLRLRCQMPKRVPVRALHLQHEQARALPGRLLPLLLLLGAKALKRAVVVGNQGLHLPGHNTSKTS